MMKITHLFFKAGLVVTILGSASFHSYSRNYLQSSTASIDERSDSTSVRENLYPVKGRRFLKGTITNQSKVSEDSIAALNIPQADVGKVLVSGKNIQLIALGGGLTAGVRNGGLYRFGQLTAFPNLVAARFGVKGFQSPIFNRNEANGTGYLMDLHKDEYPLWNVVSNNLAALREAEYPEFERYRGLPVQNFGIPHGDLIASNTPLCQSGCGIYHDGKTWTFGQIFGARILDTGISQYKVSLMEFALMRPYTFFFLEEGFDELIDLVKDNTNLDSYGFDKANLAESSMLKLTIEKLIKKSPSSNGVLFTIPMVTDLPYLSWYSAKKIKTKAKSLSIKYARNQTKYFLGPQSEFYFLPTESVDSLFRNFSGGELDLNLSNADIMDAQEIYMTTTTIKLFNNCIRNWAKTYNLALVDLEDLYHRVNANVYTGEGHILISGGREGNFFSSDGIYPSALGHAVIANEVIKSINSTYGSSVLQINLKKFASQVDRE
ncbi:hypothetical protein [Dyadobacter alkalitolerans]|uniref:hypothetical protein n=1 Tax=Dyadobacter alkalitolerans TaxID=492736 RepID=UPI00042042EE|nr:hypothetical protein [Dyadobacter alkalitolerans]